MVVFGDAGAILAGAPCRGGCIHRAGGGAGVILAGAPGRGRCIHRAGGDAGVILTGAPGRGRCIHRAGGGAGVNLEGAPGRRQWVPWPVAATPTKNTPSCSISHPRAQTSTSRRLGSLSYE